MDSLGKLVQSLQSLELDLPPSCVEFCPAYPSYFLVGTYSLQATSNNEVRENADDEERDENSTQQRQPQSRNGSIVVFELSDGAM